MIADEVGMGKTIEAASILKVFFSRHSDVNALIVVPGGAALTGPGKPDRRPGKA